MHSFCYDYSKDFVVNYLSLVSCIQVLFSYLKYHFEFENLLGEYMSLAEVTTIIHLMIPWLKNSQATPLIQNFKTNESHSGSKVCSFLFLYQDF
jgi:hypothetical protein